VGVVRCQAGGTSKWTQPWVGVVGCPADRHRHRHHWSGPGRQSWRRVESREAWRHRSVAGQWERELLGSLQPSQPRTSLLTPPRRPTPRQIILNDTHNNQNTLAVAVDTCMINCYTPMEIIDTWPTHFVVLQLHITANRSTQYTLNTTFQSVFTCRCTLKCLSVWNLSGINQLWGVASCQAGENSNNNSNSHDNVYGAVIVAVNRHCESSPGSFGQSSTSVRHSPTFGPDQMIWISDPPTLTIAIYYHSARKLILILPSHGG